MKILSLGWGVQSFTLAAMSALGELEPIDAAIHSDTGYESQLTYEFAKRWTGWLEDHGVKVVTVHGTNGTLDELFYTTKSGNKFLRIPSFIKNQDGTSSIRPRQCTTNWKIVPMRRWEQKNRNKQPIEQWIGISLDEVERMRLSDVKYITHRWPLIEKRMTRLACINWLEKNGLEVPPKSACVFCPFHNIASWRRTKAVPEDWARAIELDEYIRFYDPPFEHYLANKLVPLAELDLSTPEENGQMSFFDCSGTCWL
jgi:hypothetical protein